MERLPVLFRKVEAEVSAHTNEVRENPRLALFPLEVFLVQMMLLWFPYTVLLCGHVSCKLLPDYNVKLQSRYAELSSLDLVATLSEYELYILLKKDEDFVIFYPAIPVTHFS
ncbi:Hypothetical predicted protein [Olea europaea subsp. europaea]|uniref:Uncharacterized protein n=1 Tax=Olea europaea subsp. europaea TaxID=158383 RepID=A0A8S0RUR6_OLEEU|nr:Hypothetical predicted protein [Olea europaea subsp. europaea]